MNTLDTVCLAAETIVRVSNLERFVGIVWTEENSHEEACGCDEGNRRFMAVLDLGRDELFRARRDLRHYLGELSDEEQEDARFIASVRQEIGD